MKKNINFQDPFSFITKLIQRLDGAKSETLEKALDAVKRGKPDEATALLLTLPDIELALGCVVSDANGKLVADQGWIPDFILEAKKKGVKPAEKEKSK